MKCCTNKLVFNSLIHVPPDINPPVGNQLYMYSLVIEGYLYDPPNDTYNGLVVNGVTYNVGGGSLLNTDLGGDTITALGADYAQALPDQTGNGYNYLGIQDASFFLYPYQFIFVTSEPQTISVNVTLNGVTSNIPVTGGLVTMANNCCTVTAPNPTDLIEAISFSIPNEVGGNTTITQIVGGISINDTAQQVSIFGTFINTINTLLPFNVTFLNNGNGTYTVTYYYPQSPVQLEQLTVLGSTYNFVNC